MMKIEEKYTLVAVAPVHTIDQRAHTAEAHREGMLETEALVSGRHVMNSYGYFERKLS